MQHGNDGRSARPFTCLPSAHCEHSRSAGVDGSEAGQIIAMTSVTGWKREILISTGRSAQEAPPALDQVQPSGTHQDEDLTHAQVAASQSRMGPLV